MADFDPLHVGASVQTYPGLAISNIRLKRALFNSLLGGAERSVIFAAAKTDTFFRVPAIELADAQHAAGGRVWQYLFTWPSPRRGGTLGACHALEIPFVFNTFDQRGATFLTGKNPPLDLARDVNATWAAFARHGDPGLGALYEWPAYEPSQRLTKIIDTVARVEPDPLREERLLWMTTDDRRPIDTVLSGKPNNCRCEPRI